VKVLKSSKFLLDENKENPYVVVRSKNYEAPDGRKVGWNLNKDDLKMTTSVNGIAFVTRGRETISEYCEELIDYAPFPSGSIAIPMGGASGYAKLIHRPFYVGRDVFVLVPRKGHSLSDYEKAAHVQQIRNLSWRYNFGRQMNTTFSNIQLDRHRPPFLRTLLQKIIPQGAISMDKFEDRFKRMEFADFPLSKLGEITSGKEMEKVNRQKPDSLHKGHPFLTTTIKHNMNSAYNEGEWSINGRCVVRNNDGHISVRHVESGGYVPPNGGAGTIAFDFKGGSPGMASYQFEDYYCYSDLKMIALNKEYRSHMVGLFIAWRIRHSKWRWSKTRKISNPKHDQYIVSLPVDVKGNVDVKAIKKLMRKLPLSSCIRPRPLKFHHARAWVSGA
jgi:hypothetical protein